MKPLGEKWDLHEGDELLGALRRRETDQPWVICDFSTTAAFEREYRARFDESLRLLETDDVDEWEDFYDGLVANLRLEAEPDAAKVTDFILHIEGSEARFRAMFEDE
jgi:hypothetical protein